MFSRIDQLLRGEFRPDRKGEATAADLNGRTLLVLGAVMGAIYGVFMGLYGAMRAGAPQQVPVAAVKVPLLMFATLLVTLPSLYVFATLAGARLDIRQVLRLALATIGVALTVIASLGPITGFFTLSTESYGFMVFLNVIFFTIAGLIGVSFLYASLKALIAPTRPAARAPRPAATADAAPADPAEETGEEPAAAPRPELDPWERPRRRDETGTAGIVLRIWIVMFAVVGGQMAWILRPFVVDPKREWQLFRDPTESSFFEATWTVFIGFFR